MDNINSQTDSEQFTVGLSSNLIKYSLVHSQKEEPAYKLDTELLVGDILHPDTHLVLSADRLTHTIR